jgi:hypothetical protein
VAGNGGDWVEFVVTGNGSAGTTDLRGWTIEIDEGAGSGFFAAKVRIQLSDASFWAAVPNGTILTFTEKNTAQGGWDTNLSGADNSTTSGWRWANIWVGDAALVTYTDPVTNGYTLISGVVDGINIDDTQTQFRVLNGSGYAVFGPAGEGIAPVTGIGPTDVLELEGHPTAAVLPTDRSDDTATPPKSGYDNSSKGSTFGAPNEWHIGAGGSLTVQNFSAYGGSAGDTTPPVITLAGDNPLTVLWGLTWIDDFSAFDAGDNTNVTVTRVNQVDTKKPGTYTNLYTAADSKGNAATNTRVVHVRFANGGSERGADGLPDAVRYALGADGTNPLAQSLRPAGNVSGSQLVLSYQVRPDAGPVELVPVVSTSLANSNSWTTSGVTVTPGGTTNVNGEVLERRQASVPVDGTRKFLRLKATSQ